MVGVAIEVSAFNTWGQICVGRFLAGAGVGATSGLVPVFQAEASPPALRGLITGSFQLNVTLGYVFASTLDLSCTRLLTLTPLPQYLFGQLLHLRNVQAYR